MKAVAIEKFGGADLFKMVDLPLPTPKRNEVRIRIRASAFNPVDVKIRKGGRSQERFPLVLGADCSGIIDAVGDPNGEFAIGDEVVSLVFERGSNGTYAEYVVIPAAFVVKKPHNLTFEQAASIPLTALTAFQALIASGALQRERSLFIAGGAGGVGSIAISLARLYKADPIITTAGSDESTQYLIEKLHIPKDHILRYKGLSLEQMETRALELNRQERFAAAFDAVGGEMKKLALRVVDFYGHVSTILPEPKGFPVDLWTRSESVAFEKSLSIHFIYVGSAAASDSEKSWRMYKVQLKAILQFFERGELPVPHIEKVGTLSVDTVRAAHLKLESGHTLGKLVMAI